MKRAEAKCGFYGLKIKLLLVVATLSGLLGVASAQVMTTAGKITVDGKLDEADWGKAQKYSNFNRMISESKQKLKVAADTEFRVLCDNDNIYFGIKCFEPKMNLLKANITGNDANPWLDDVLEIFLSPTNMPDEYYQFVVSAGNGRWCMYYAEKGNIRPDPYAPLWESAVYKGKDFWSVEIKLPISGFYMTNALRWNTEWLVNVGRQRMPEIEISSWSPLYAAFNEATRFNKIAGFPSKNAKVDIYVKSLDILIKNFQDKSYSGALDVKIEADTKAVGEYKIRCSSDVLDREYTLPGRLNSGINIIKFDKILFKKLGKVLIRCEIIDKSGKTIAGRDYPVLVDYQPVSFVFDQPGYSRCFFPGQSSDQISGKIKIKIPDTMEKTAQIKLVLKADGIATQEKTLSPKDGGVDFSFDVKDLKYGNAEISATVLNGNQAIASASTIVRKLAPVKKALWIENKRLIINGKPTYGLSIYAEQYMGGKWFGEERFKSIRTFLFPAANDIGAMVDLQPLGLISGIETKEGTRDVKPCDELFVKTREHIEKNRGKDFNFYYLSDEPECRGISSIYLQYLYDFIKELDPYHPVMITSREPGRYLNCADVVGTHPYINPMVSDKGVRTLTLPVDRVRDYCDEVSLSGRSDKVLCAVFQTFSYGFQNAYSDYPTFNEFNATIWSSIVHGAQVQFPYAYHDIGDRPALFLGLRFVNESILALQDILTAPENKLPVKAQGNDKKLDLMLTEHDGKILFVAVNLGNAPLKTEISSESLKKYKQLQVFRGNRTAAVQDGKFLLDMEPYQVVILTSERMDTELKSFAEFKQELDNAEKGRTERGNILFGHGYDIELSSSGATAWTGVLRMQMKLFDGTLDVVAWQTDQKSPWLEMSFPKFVPKFNKARVWGYGVKDMEFSIWKRGEWIKIKPTTIKNEHYMTELDFGTELSTIKIKLQFNPVNQSIMELYEIELLH